MAEVGGIGCCAGQVPLERDSTPSFDDLLFVFVIKILRRQKHNCVRFEKTLHNNLNTYALGFANSFS